MIWIGRILSVPAGLLFFVLLLVTLVVLQVNATFLDPGFYPEEMRKADIYEFVLVDLLTSAIDEYREQDPPEGLDENPLVTSGLSTEDIVSSVNRAIPPSWVRGLVEQSFDEVGRYLTGERDEFEVTVRAGDQVIIVKDEVKALLRKAGAYNLLYGQQVVPTVRDAVDQELPLGVTLSADRVISSVRRVAPPDWVQGQVESALDEVTPYLVGSTDTFNINVQVADRVEIALEEIKDLLRDTDAYGQLFDKVVEPAITDTVNAELPLGLEVSSDRLVDAARVIVPSDWMRLQVESAVDEVGPYVVGKRDSFEINVQLADRVAIALAEIKDLLREIDAYDLLYWEVIEPQVRENLGGVIDLPFGVTIADEEVISALRRVAPPTWVREQAKRVIDEVTPYLTGEADSFTVEVSLVDNKLEARDVIDDLVSQKVTELIDSVSKCESLTAAATALLNRDSRGLPGCVPEDVSGTDLLSVLSIDVSGAVASLVLATIPDTIPFGDVQLRQALTAAGAGDNLEQVDEMRRILKEGWTYDQDDLRSELAKRGDDVVETLDTVREILRDGWTYTQDDLREVLTDENAEDPMANVKRLDDVRAFLADGWTYTSADFREDISGEADGTSLEDFYTGRDTFKRVRAFRWVLYLPLVILLVVIAFLGGRGWSGRVAWAAGVLLVSVGLIVAIWGPGYSALAKSGPIYEAAGIGNLDEQREEVLDKITHPEKYDSDAPENEFPETSSLAANKGFDIVESIADDFASGIVGRSLALGVIGLIALLAALFWTSINSFIDRVADHVRRIDTRDRVNP